MIYLDNAATSFPKPDCVIKEVNRCIKKYCANSGRSSHSLAIKTDEEIYRARESIASLLSIDTPERVCFTQNTTYALNLAIKTTLREKCHVLISDLEHNSVLRPLYKLKCTLGIEYSIFSTDGNIEENIKKLIRHDTRAIISTLMSNVTGATVPISVLSKIAKDNGLILIVDAAQYIGHQKIDLSLFPCNVLCAPAHKALFGLQGCGFAVFLDNIPRESFIEGGSGSESKRQGMPDYLPERFEAGTLPTPSIVALRSGIEYIEEIGYAAIDEHLSGLCAEYSEMIRSIKGTEIFGAGGGIISFRIKGVPSHMVAELLDKYGICVRSGLHCAPLAHKKLGTSDSGLVRISFSWLSKKTDIDVFYKALREINP